MLSQRRPWFDAWVDSAYGGSGFWRSAEPTDHFSTPASQVGLLAALVADCARVLDERQGAPVTRVVDIGAGGGSLLQGLAARRPDLSLVGVDLRPRPAGLPAAVAWIEDHWDVRSHRWSDGSVPALLGAVDAGRTLVVATEWLDDLPARVVQRADGGWREMAVAPDGAEGLSGEPSVPDRDWLDRWWPDGDRAEVGVTRDRAWAALVAALRGRRGGVLTIDYGHLRRERPAGSLAAYADGVRRTPQPGGGRNLTAGVAIDAVEAAGVAAGACTVSRRRLRDVVLAAAPGRELDPLADLAARSERAALAAPHRWGDQWWLLQEVP